MQNAVYVYAMIYVVLYKLFRSAGKAEASLWCDTSAWLLSWYGGWFFTNLTGHEEFDNALHHYPQGNNDNAYIYYIQ